MGMAVHSLMQIDIAPDLPGASDEKKKERVILNLKCK